MVMGAARSCKILRHGKSLYLAIAGSTAVHSQNILCNAEVSGDWIQSSESIDNSIDVQPDQLMIMCDEKIGKIDNLQLACLLQY